MFRILVVDDDSDTCRFMEDLLAAPDREIVSRQEAESAMAEMRAGTFDLLVSDLNLNAARSGMDVLRAFRTAHPRGQAVLVSAFGSLETAIEALRNGAFDFISKPFDIADVKRVVGLALRQAGRGDDPLPATLPGPPAGLIGRTAPMLEVYKQIARAADSQAAVLIVGESGTGKELVARAIHAHGRRAREPFVAINCGAVVDSLLESEMFGHVRGAFTGAVSDRAGVFAEAGAGTVFLDEIGETSPSLQVKLLRVLEEGEVRPVGASRTVRVVARVVAATNVDLEQAVASGRFRRDLYFRLGVIVIQMPTLAERRADIPLLIGSFLKDACARAGRMRTLSAEVLQALMKHSWPGNVRELRNTIERLVVFSRGAVIEGAELEQLGAGLARGPAPSVAAPFDDLPSLGELERRYLMHVLDRVGGNRTRAAEVLGIDRRTLYRMADRFGIELKD